MFIPLLSEQCSYTGPNRDAFLDSAIEMQRTSTHQVYLLPMLDGLEFGRDVFHAVPALGSAVHIVLAPALAVWDHVPFMPIVMFIILQVSVRRQDTSR